MFTRIWSAWFGWMLFLGVLLPSCRSNGGETSQEVAASSPAAPLATQPLKVGVLAPFSGPFASLGAQVEGGIKAYKYWFAIRPVWPRT
jgi:hypothetical protein